MSGDVLSRLAGAKRHVEEEYVAEKPYHLICDRPIEVDTLDELKGIPDQLIEDMILRTLTNFGAMDEHHLSHHLKISKKIIETFCRDLDKRKFIGPKPSDPRQWIIGEEGKARAEEAQETTRYVGPIPVDDEEYVSMMRLQLGQPMDFSQEDIEAAYSKLVIYDTEFMRRIGPAVRSQRSILLYGAPGNGKTIMGKCLTNLMKADLLIPYSIYTSGQIIKLFDQSVHKPVEEDEFKEFDIERVSDVRYDRRWIVIKVPYVEVATEFTLADFELNYNSYARYYEMPLHVKANGGVFFIDDFGRQKGSPEDYMNRLITPLQMKEDILRLTATGGQIRVPFFCIPLFSTNLTLDKIGDEAFLRRFKYKILARSPKPDEFHEIFKFECQRTGVNYSRELFDYIIGKFEETGHIIRACHANDLISKIIDYCTYYRETPRLDKELIDMSWELNFSDQAEDWAFGMGASKGGEAPAED